MKKLIQFTIVLLLSNVFMSVYSYGQESDFIIEDGVLIDYIGSDDAELITVPEGVIEIGERAFDGYDNNFRQDNKEHKIILPQSLKKIGPSAFYGDWGLYEIIIPSGVEEIGDLAFFDTNLTSIIVPDSVTTLGYSVFADSRLKEATLPNHMKSIPVATFSHNPLEIIHMADDVTEIGARAFSYTSLDEFEFPEGTTIIAGGVFYQADLKKVTIPSTVEKILDVAFYASDIEELILPEGLEVFEDGVIGHCNQLSKISIPSSNEFFSVVDDVLYTKDMTKLIYYPNGKADIFYSIPDSVFFIGEAFHGNQFLKYVIVPESVTRIWLYSFYACESLETIVIPETVEMIGQSAFDACNKLTIVCQPGSVAEWIAKNGSISYRYMTDYDNAYYEYAMKLSQINVFKGSDKGFGLDSKPNRIEGLIMLIRMLGVEEEAGKLANQPCVFSDVPSWAIGYVNYGYEHGLTNGVSDTKFGSYDVLEADVLMTLMLRSIGYDDKQGDFQWDQSLDFADKNNLVDEEIVEQLQYQALTRGHVAKITYDNLFNQRKDSDKTQLEFLNEKGGLDKLLTDHVFGWNEDDTYELRGRAGYRWKLQMPYEYSISYHSGYERGFWIEDEGLKFHLLIFEDESIESVFEGFERNRLWDNMIWHKNDVIKKMDEKKSGEVVYQISYNNSNIDQYNVFYMFEKDGLLYTVWTYAPGLNGNTEDMQRFGEIWDSLEVF